MRKKTCFGLKIRYKKIEYLYKIFYLFFPQTIMKKKLWWWFTFSPVIIAVLWLLVSLVFRLLGVVWVATSLSLILKSFINRWLWIFALLSFPLMIIGIVFLSTAKSKNAAIFTIKEIVQYSRKASKKYMSKFLLGFGMYIVAQIISGAFGYSEESGNVQLRNLAITWVIMLVSARIGLWYKNLALNIVHNVKAKSADVFVGFQMYIKYLAAYVLVYIIVVLGLILFIVPGIVFWIKLSMVPYLILDKQMKPIQAIKSSWKMTTWFAGDILLLNILCGLINIVGMLVVFVGLLWTVPLLIVANAYLYKKLVESTEYKV